MLFFRTLLLFKKYIFLIYFQREWKERDRNIDLLPLTCPQLGSQPTTQACALTGNQTSDPSVHRLALNPRSHTSQGENPASKASLATKEHNLNYPQSVPHLAFSHCIQSSFPSLLYSKCIKETAKLSLSSIWDLALLELSVWAQINS